MPTESVQNNHQPHPPWTCSAEQSVQIKTKEKSIWELITSQRQGERSFLRQTLMDNRQASGDVREQENGKAIIRSEPQIVKSWRDQKDTSRKRRSTTFEDCWALKEQQRSSVKWGGWVTTHQWLLASEAVAITVMECLTTLCTWWEFSHQKKIQRCYWDSCWEDSGGLWWKSFRIISRKGKPSYCSWSNHWWKIKRKIHETHMSFFPGAVAPLSIWNGFCTLSQLDFWQCGLIK